MRNFRELNQQINEVKRVLNSFIQKLTANRTDRNNFKIAERHHYSTFEVGRSMFDVHLLINLFNSHITFSHRLQIVGCSGFKLTEGSCIQQRSHLSEIAGSTTMSRPSISVLS